MGLPPFLADTYQRYKIGTKWIVQWLAATARATGKVDELFCNTGEEGTQRTKRKKGRGRKRAPKQKTTHQISVKDFVKLAQAIVSTKKADVPHTASVILWDVIRLRKECVAYYRSQQDSSETKREVDEDAHEYFVTQLEEVQRIISPFVEKTTTNKAREVKKHDEEKEDNVNIYQHLDKAPSDNQDLEDTYELEDVDEDPSFAIYCFISTATDVRVFVRRTWRSYLNRQITLNNAATTMNAAIGAIRRLNEEFILEFPQFADHQDIIDFVAHGYCAPNIDPGTEEIDLLGYERKDLQLSSENFFCYFVTEYASKICGATELLVSLAEIEYHLQEDQRVWAKCLALMALLGVHIRRKDQDYVTGGVASDQILWAVSLIRLENKMPTWTVFALQFLLDTQRELGSQLNRCFTDLRKDSAWIKDAFNDCHKQAKTLLMNHWSKGNDRRVEQLIKYIEDVTETDNLQCLVKAILPPEKAEEINWGSYFLLKNSPLLCGLHLQGFLACYHTLGNSIVSEQALVLCAMHFLNAAQFTGFVPPNLVWADLEYLIRNYGDDLVFPDQRPKALKQCCKSFWRAYGVKEHVFSINPDNKKAIELALGRQKNEEGMIFVETPMGPLSRYVQLFGKRHRKGTVLSRAARHPWIMLERLVNKTLEPPATRSKDGGPYRESQPKLSPLESLTIFRDALRDDEFALRFDMFGMNKRCVNLFRRIQSICVVSSPRLYPKHLFGSDTDLVNVLGYMFMWIVRTENTQPPRFLEACQEMMELVEKEGNIEYLKAQARVGMVSWAPNKDQAGSSGCEISDKDPQLFHIQ